MERKTKKVKQFSFIKTSVLLTVNTKIQLVRYGVLEHMHPAIRRISVQSLKETDERFFKFANLDNLKKQVKSAKLFAIMSAI